MPLASVLFIYASYTTLSHLNTIVCALSGSGRPTASKALHFFATLVAVVAFGSFVVRRERRCTHLSADVLRPDLDKPPTGPTFLAMLLSFLLA